jgi:tyrosine-protein phosphatase YwqE
MPTNKEIIEKNLEEEDYRVEFRIKYKYYKLLEKKLELEKNNKSEYIRELIIKDLKKIVSGDESTSKITQDFKLVRSLVDETISLSKAVNKLGVLLNQAVREKIFEDEVRKDTQKELYSSLEKLTEENIKLKNLFK